jgi:2-C-methyl-D-erythritol 2,4-cyclodiphosphate synthase
MRNSITNDFRVGIGFDAHGLVQGRELIIGGVSVPHERGLEGHSDGDVLSHSIIDALLGASNLGDKGVYFPSESTIYKGISSLILLEKTIDILNQNGWRISNVDATILAQKPRLAPFISDMVSHISRALSIPITRVSIKVTSTDYMGFTGREEGIASCCVASVFS